MADTTSDNSAIVISHVGDFKQVVPDGVLLVKSDHDYAKTCYALAQCAANTTGTEVWVRNEPHYRWLEQFSEQTGIRASFRRQTPRTLLATRWGVSAPKWLTDEAVLSQGLLTMVPPKHATKSFQELMLAESFGPSLVAPQLTEENVRTVVELVAGPDAKPKFTERPSLRQCLADVCQAWIDSSHDSWSGWVARGLTEDADALWRELTLWSLLAGYPDKLLEFAVPSDRIVFLREVPLKAVTELPLHPVGAEQAWSQIEVFFADVKSDIQDNESFRKLLGCVSARLRAEFHELATIMGAGTFAPDSQSAAQLKKAFRGSPGISSTMLDSLDRFIQPPTPSLVPDGSFRDAKAWIDWTINEYTPYRHWQALNRKYDPEVEEEVRWFSKWYIDEYEAIHQDSALSLTHALSNWVESIAADELSIILMVDCLPLIFWPILETALSGVGLHRHGLTHRFAPLPTDTAHCKAGIIAGHWESSNKKYAQLLTDRVAADWPGKTSLYAPDIKVLTKMRSVDPNSVVLLNLLPSDELLHTDVETSGATHAEELHRLFSRVAEAVSALVAASEIQSNKLGVYVLTDHGAVMVLPEEMTSLESKVIANLFPDDRHRYASIPKQDAGHVPENLWKLGHQFVPPFGTQETSFFIPAGHNTVGSQAERMRFMHGGATPEEVIVPTACFRKAPQALAGPSWRFLDLRLDAQGMATFYVCRTVRVQLELQNSAHEPLAVTESEVLSPSTDVKSASTAVIPPGETRTLVYDLYFSRSAVEADSLVLHVTYEIAGQERVLEVRLPAIFRSAQTGGFSLRDL